jgi:uncharacterized membrane protein YbhN (UPF0104 family)
VSFALAGVQVRAGPQACRWLAQRDPGCSDAELSQVRDAVGRLHARKVMHRGLTADRILLTDDGQAMLLDPGDGDIAASDLQIRLDVAQVVAFVLHVLLIIVFTAIVGSSGGEPVPAPQWAWLALAGLVLIALVVLAIPARRRMLRARLSPMLGQVLPRLLQVAQQPRKLARGIGGTLLLSLSYIFCLTACVAAFSRSVPIAKIGVVYLTGSAIGSIMPTPGGLGAVETALTAGLTAAGGPGAAAASAVLLFRLLTFWLPVPFGWGP